MLCRGEIFCEDGRFEAKERTCESLIEGDCAEVCSIVSKVRSGKAFAKSKAAYSASILAWLLLYICALQFTSTV
jgi:hypothetical protein